MKYWRRAFQALFFLIAGFGFGWPALSIMATHLGWFGVSNAASERHLSDGPVSINDLRRCYLSLQVLSEELRRASVEHHAKLFRRGVNPTSDWQQWARKWNLRWSRLASRCRLDDVSHGPFKQERSRLADVHGDLAELQHLYTATIKRSVERYVDRLQTIDQQLQSLNAIIRDATKKTRDFSAIEIQ